jgi:hypothetical protein
MGEKSAGNSLGIPADFPETPNSAGKFLGLPADFFLQENPQKITKFLVVYVHTSEFESRTPVFLL